MPFLRYALAALSLAVGGGLIVLGVNEQHFALIDYSVVAVCLITGVVLIWTTYRAGKPRREERKRRRSYARRR